MFCADLAQIVPGMTGALHFSDHSVTAETSDFIQTVSHYANETTINRADKPISSGASNEPLDLASQIADALPATVGNFNQQAISFTTAANGMPILNSLPSAPTAIFLDFDGDTTTSTQPYDEDSNPTTFNTSEQNNIANAWKQISQYFSIFDTNVTTIEPTAPKAWNVIGNNIVGGYSYVNVFPNSYPRSFNNSGDARTRVSGLAHELGHNFGLWHQSDYDLLGNKTAEYSSGFDSLHGPIMGVDYAQSVHKWFIGHGSESASTLQDDIAQIANRVKTYQPVGGDGFKADDFGNTIALASPLNVVNEYQVASGTLERMSDIDSFSFNSIGGTYTVAALPDGVSGVDLKLEIYDASGTLVAAKDSSTNQQIISLTLGTGTYYALLSSHGNYGDLGSYNLAVSSLPSGWNAQDIGSVGIAGSSAYNAANGTFTIDGSGANVSGTADAMQFASQTLTGDGTMIARVDSITGTNTAAKAGLEIRETTATNAKHVAMVQTFGSGPQMLVRSTTGGTTTAFNSAAQTFAPKWLKLTRVGNVFTGYSSNDGIAWSQLGTSTVSMNSQVSIGLIATAVNNSKLNTSTLSNVGITGTLGAPAPVYNTLVPVAGVSVTPATGTGLGISWNDTAGESGYRVERSTDGVNFTSAGTTSADVTSYVDPGLLGSMRYFYRVIALNVTGGGSAPSVVASGVNRPNAISNFAITSLDSSRVVLNWRDTHGESGFRIERSPDGVNYTTVATVGVNIPSYTDSGLTIGTSYTYRVTPLSSTGDGTSATATGSTRLPAVSGLAFDAKTSNSMTFHWNDLSGETSYRIERSTDGTTFTTLTTLAANAVSYTDNTVLPANEYYYRVVGVNSLTQSVFPTPIFAAAPSSNPLPAPWSATDIGAVNGSGTTDFSAGTFTVVSSGVDIWGTADTFRYTYQPLTGDGSITARVASAENTGGWAKLGVMVRESLAPNSKHAMAVVTPGNGVALQYRTATGGASTHLAGPSVAAPYWVRMTRVGNVLSAFSSADGTTWDQFGAVTISMSSTVYIGLSADANTSTLLNTSTFTNVNVSNNAPTVASAASASPNLVTGTNTNLAALAADDHGEANVTYTWSVTAKPAGAADPVFAANGSNAAKNTSALFSQAGSYTFLVTMTDSGGLSVTNSVNVNVLQTLSSITVSPSGNTVSGGTSLQFTATTIDQFAAALTVQPSIVWSASGGGSISATGLYSAPNATLSATITATSGTIAGTASVNVVSSNQAPFFVNGASATPAIVTGTSTNLAALAGDDAGEASLVYTWSIAAKPGGAADPLFAANGTNSAKSTAVTFSQAGIYSFIVTATDAGGLTATSSIEVDVRSTLTTIVVSPDGAAIDGGTTLQYSAVGSDQFANVLSPQPAFSWSVSGGGSISSSGLYLAPATTVTATITAANGSVSDSANVQVTAINAAPTIVNAPLASPDLVTGLSTNLSVTANDDGGEASLIYTWLTTSKPIGAADPLFSLNGTNAAKNVTATFASAGAYTFTVEVRDVQNLSVTATVNVSVSQTATSMTLSPIAANLAGGGTQTFNALIFDQFGASLASRPTITWNLTGPGSLTQAGVYTAAETSGTASITAAAAGLLRTADITIANQNPTIVNPASSATNPVAGTNANLSVLAADDRGENTLSYQWSVATKPIGANNPIFSVNGSNAAKTTTATFSQAGVYGFNVAVTDLGGRTVTSFVNVTVNQTATNISVSPITANVHLGTTQQFTASVRDQFGIAIATPPLTWAVQSGGGTINASGLYTAPLVLGTSVIRATSDTVSSTASVTIVNNGPAAPTTVSASSLTANAIRVNWSSSTVGVAGFYVDYSSDGLNWTRITVASASTRTYTVTGLNSNTTYQFRVAAYNSAGLQSPFGSIVSAKTKRR